MGKATITQTHSVRTSKSIMGKQENFRCEMHLKVHLQ